MGNRRSFIGTLLGGIMALFAAAFAGIAGAFLSPPPRRDERSDQLTNAAGRPIDADSIPLGGSVTGRLLGRPVIVVRHPDGLRALSAVCTHAGCLVSWDAGEQSYLCPCHGARFDAAGGVTRLPATGPLESIPIRVTAEGHIEAMDSDGARARAGGFHAA